ncbi:MATE efflux family isoform A [Micractinium conductrix]|uniref:Protein DETOXIFICATION n=1 Tax=Micractinium conductrix TaxID=554055 RepID=A0A2P6VA13_9CHLO|nr:MATE efflux family isoform A [Micractinium conductrix]|eukprot:PSC70934.1 MATE efflux family isoform A [Micractinium conductrix]
MAGTRRRHAPLSGAPPPQRAADLARGLGGDDDEDASAVEATAAAWWRRLVSPFDKEIFLLAVPALFSVLLDPIMGMVSTAIIGSRLGTTSLAAVGLTTIVFNFSNFIWNFLLYTTTPRIAAAVARKDEAGVSAITAQGLWLAATIGLSMTLLLTTQCPVIFAAMGAAPEVVAHASEYMRMRCLASPAILMYYVLSGTFRGFKDTRTPLYAGILGNLLHLGLIMLLVFGLGWGVAGAGLATSLSHWLSIAFLLANVLGRGYMRPADLTRVPAWSEVSPMLRSGLFLSTRSLLAMGMLMWATRLIAGFGAVGLAAHEILRQIWVLSNQAYTSLDIATQSLVAFHLGKGDRRSAAAVFRRTLRLAVGAGVVIMGGLLAGQHSLPAIFTRDSAVISQVSAVMPLIAVFMPLDAAASVMDGVLLGSQEAGWMGQTMCFTAAACGAGLLASQRLGWPILGIWCIIKFLTVGRLIGNTWRLWSRSGPLAGELGIAGAASPAPQREHFESAQLPSELANAEWQALLLLDGRPLGKLVAPALEWSTEPGAPPGLSLRFTRLVEAPVPAAAAAVRDSAAEPARQPRASAAQPQPLRLPVDGGFAQRTFRVQVVGRRHGAPAVAPRAYDVHGRDLVAGLSVQRQWQQYQQRHQAARTSAGQPVSAANFAHSSTLTVESGDGLERLQAIFDGATATAWLKGIVCRFLVPEAASPDAGLPAGGSSVAVEEQTGAAAAPSDLPANRGSKAHGGKAVAGSKAQPAAQPSVQPATEDAVAGGSNGSGSSYLSYCSSEGFRTPSRPSNYGLPYAFGPANQLPWHDAVGMGQQAAYTFAHKPLAEAQRMGRRSTGSFAANRGYYAAPQAVHPSNVSMPALPAYHRRTTSSSSSIGSHGGSEAGGLAAYQSAPPRWQGSHLNTWAEPFSPRSQQQYLASQPAPPPYARVHSLPAHPQRSHGSEPAGDAYWQQHWRSGSDWHQPQLSADALPSYTLPQMAVHGGAVGGASAGGWSNSGMPYSAPASTATSPTLYSAGLPPLPPPPPGMPSSTAPPPPPPLLSVPVLDLQVPESVDDSPDLERFLQAATPQVVPPPSGAQDLTLADLWRWYERPSTFGCEVATIGGPRGPATAYYLPFLSAVQLLAPVSAADEAAVAAAAASGDAGAAQRSGTAPPQLLTYPGGLDEWPERMRPVVQWGESASMRDRVPLHTCLAGLCGEAGEEHPLMSTRLADLHPFSWFAVAWYPLYCVPEAPLTARFVTFHTLASLWEAASKAAAEAQQEQQAQLEAAAAEAARQRRAAEAAAAAAAAQPAGAQPEVAAMQSAEEQEECATVQHTPAGLRSRPSYKSMLEAGLPAEAAPLVGTPACTATPTAVCSFPGSPTCSDAGTRTTLGSYGSRSQSVDGGTANSTGTAVPRSRLALGSTADSLAGASSCGGCSVQGPGSLTLSASERGSCSAAGSIPASPAASEAGDNDERKVLPVAVAGLAWYATGRCENWTDCLVAAQLPADAAVPLPPPGTPLAGGARLLGTWRGVAVLARPYPVAKGGPLGWEIQQEEMALCAERLASGGGLVALRPASGGRWQELRGLPPAQLGVGCPDYEFFMSRSARYC